MFKFSYFYSSINVLPRGEGFEKVNSKVSKLEDEFTSRLDKAEFRLYDELSTTRNERDSYYYLETFIEGFQIGARMIMEAFSDEQ